MTKERIASENLLNEIENWMGLSDFESVMEYIENSKTRGSFASYDNDTPILKNESLYINLREFFTSTEYGGDYEHLTIDQLKEYMAMYGGATWSEKIQGNTYNYAGSLQRDVAYKLFDNDLYEDVLVFISVHYGLDARYGYTKSFVMNFDDEYSFLEFITQGVSVAEIEFNHNGKNGYCSVRASASSDYITLDFSDDINIYDDAAYIDLYDSEDLKTSFEEYLKENEIAFEAGSIVVNVC